MPTCHYCNCSYSDPELDNLSEEEWGKLFEEGGDDFLLTLDCGNQERHLSVINECQKELIRGAISEREDPDCDKDYEEYMNSRL